MQHYFKNIFLEHYSILCTYAFRLVKDAVVAEDIVQDVFAAVWARREEIDFSSSIKPLLYKYTHNKALDYLKSSSYNTERLDENNIYSMLDIYVQNLIVNQPEDDLNFRELNEEILKCIDNLPDQCKNVYKLSRFSNLKNKEISDTLCISIKTVEKHISRALSEIRRYLDEKGLLSLLLLAILFFKK